MMSQVPLSWEFYNVTCNDDLVAMVCFVWTHKHNQEMHCFDNLHLPISGFICVQITVMEVAQDMNEDEQKPLELGEGAGP